MKILLLGTPVSLKILHTKPVSFLSSFDNVYHEICLCDYDTLYHNVLSWSTQKLITFAILKVFHVSTAQIKNAVTYARQIVTNLGQWNINQTKHSTTLNKYKHTLIMIML